jgi:hypothetical protein
MTSSVIFELLSHKLVKIDITSKIRIMHQALCFTILLNIYIYIYIYIVFVVAALGQRPIRLYVQHANMQWSTTQNGKKVKYLLRL